MDNLLLDVRYALRVLRKSPAFTVVGLISLMLGIGANIVVLGVIDAVLARPPAVSDPQSLYQIRHKQWMIGRLLTTSYPAFEDFRQRNVTFRGMGAVYGYSHGALRRRNAVRDVSGDEVSVCGARRGGSAISRLGAVCLARLLDTDREPGTSRRAGLAAEQDIDSGYSGPG